MMHQHLAINHNIFSLNLKAKHGSHTAEVLLISNTSMRSCLNFETVGPHNGHGAAPPRPQSPPTSDTLQSHSWNTPTRPRSRDLTASVTLSHIQLLLQDANLSRHRSSLDHRPSSTQSHCMVWGSLVTTTTKHIKAPQSMFPTFS